MTLEAPPTIHESNLEFNVTVILLRREETLTRLEIDIMDTEITAINPGKLESLIFTCESNQNMNEIIPSRNTL